MIETNYNNSGLDKSNIQSFVLPWHSDGDVMRLLETEVALLTFPPLLLN